MSNELVSSYTFFTVKHVAEMLVRFRIFADKREYPFVCFIICAEGYPVQLAIVLYFLWREEVVNSIIWMRQLSPKLGHTYRCSFIGFSLLRLFSTLENNPEDIRTIKMTHMDFRTKQQNKTKTKKQGCKIFLILRSGQPLLWCQLCTLLALL